MFRSIYSILMTVFLAGLGSNAYSFEACEDSIIPDSPVLSNGFGFGLKNDRNASSSIIDSSNIDKLSLDFAFVEPGINEKRGAVAVTEQAIFLSAEKKVYAVNRRSGCVYWEWENLGSSFDFVRSASVHLIDEPILGKRIIVIGSYLGELVAIDATTGSQIWSRFVSGDRINNMVTGGLQYHDGKVFVPVATKEVITAAVQPVCCFSHGRVLAVSSATGKTVWNHHMTRFATRRLFSPRRGPNGVSVWSTPLIDVKREQLLVGTSTNLSKPQTHNANSLVALDLNTGKEKWVMQAVVPDFYNASCSADFPLDFNCDMPDHDFDMLTPVLKTLKSGEDVIIVPDKSGRVYSVNPNNGHRNWASKIGAGGKLGGVHWGVAVDDEKIYVGVADVTAAKSGIGSLSDSLSDLTLESLISGDVTLEVPMVQVPGATPGVYALDINNGNVIWEVHTTRHYDGQNIDSIYSANVTVSNDLVFAGSLDGMVRAFHKDTGVELWSYNTNISVTGPTGIEGNGGTVESVGPIAAGDNLFVNSGYNTFGGTNEFQGGPGNALFVFKLAL